MPTVIVCGGCSRKLKVSESLFGKTIKCPHCAAKVQVTPQQSEASPVKAGTTKPRKPASVATKSSPPDAEPDLGALFEKETPARSTKPEARATNGVAIETTTASNDSSQYSVDESVPAPKPRPTVTAGTSVKAARKRKDDDESPGLSKLVIFGGAFVVLFLLCAGGSYLFLSGPSFGHVTGVVTLDGQPVDAAELVFFGDEDPKLQSIPGKTDKDGKYTLAGNPGIVPGKYKVIVVKMVMPDGKTPEGPSGEKARDDGLVKNLVHADYGDRGKTPLRADVRSGNNTVSFPLKSNP